MGGRSHLTQGNVVSEAFIEVLERKALSQQLVPGATVFNTQAVIEAVVEALKSEGVPVWMSPAG